MIWARATVFLRLVCLTLGFGSFGVARHLTQLGTSGLEGVPPPFILLSGLAGLGFLCLAALGRYARPDTNC
jgi:hypothetical protein